MLPRRRFLETSLGVVAGAAFATKPSGIHYRAAVIGHTGRGNFGHAIDRVFKDLPNVKTGAAADAVRAGAEKAAKLYPGAKAYTDYREMLRVEQPSLVAVCPRHSDQHHAMTLAALKAGAHVFVEKPFTQTLEEADELLAVAKEKKLKIAVAHQMICDPNITRLAKVIRDESLIGPIQKITLYGKMDRRVGGEDLIVLGTHLLDMALWLADSPPVSCEAEVLENGKPFELGDVRNPTENIGPIVGTHIDASFELENGIPVIFRSAEKFRELSDGWGLEIQGSKEKVRIYLNHPTRIVYKGSHWPTEEGAYPKYGRGEAMDLFNHIAVKDWLQAIEQDQEPICSGQRAASAVEMIQAVFASGRSRAEVKIPLAQRTHALG